MVENGFSGLNQMEDLMRKIEQMGKSIDNSLKEKSLKAGAEVAKDKIVNHPNLPVSDLNHPHARDTIEIAKASNGQIDIGATHDGFYLLFHEIGAQGGLYRGKDGQIYVTPDISAKPFVRPSFENSKDEIQKAMMKPIKKELGL